MNKSMTSCMNKSFCIFYYPDIKYWVKYIYWNKKYITNTNY